MARRLKQIAEDINARFPRLIATIEKGYCNTDRRIGRFRWPGKDRHGNRLVVRWRHLSTLDPKSKVFDHNAASPDRRNEEVERWLRTDALRLVEPKPTKGLP